MPSLYRQRIVRYRLPDGSYRTPDGGRVTSKTPGAVRVVEVSKKWYGRYTAGGREHREPLSESKERARRMLNARVGKAELAAVGIVNPFAGHQARPLAEHLEDFGRCLAARGNTAVHVKQTVAQCRAVLDGCRFL